MARRHIDLDEERGREIVASGAEAIGAVTGSAIGTIGGPLGVAAGGFGGVATARLLKELGSEISRRLLSPREKERIGGAAAVAITDIESRLTGGEALRDDGFFDFEEGERPNAAELFEGVLLQAARSYEEKKVRYLGHMYAAFAFSPTTSPEYAHVLIQFFDRLTYRQLAILAYFSDSGRVGERAALGVQIEEGDVKPSPVLIRETNRLGEERLLGNTAADGTVTALADIWAHGIQAEFFGTVAPTEFGCDLVHLAKLSDIDADDVDRVARGFRGEIQ